MFVQYRLIPPRGDKAGAHLGLHVRRGGIERALGLVPELLGRGLLRVRLPGVTIGSQCQGLVDERSRLARRTFIEDWALSVKDCLPVSDIFEVEFALQNLSGGRELEVTAVVRGRECTFGYTFRGRPLYSLRRTLSYTSI